MGFKHAPALDRFAAKIALTESGCIEWIASRNNHGYGTFAAGGDVFTVAHRWSYEYHVGPIPDGLHLDHLCRNRACVNPDHLEPVTCRTNLLRASGGPAINGTKTHCPQGHPYAGANLSITRTTGHRVCITCRRANERRRRLTRKP